MDSQVSGVRLPAIDLLMDQGTPALSPHPQQPWEGGIPTHVTEEKTEASSEPNAFPETGLCPGHV